MADPTSVGPYQVVRCLGRGGMGVVYECRHPLLPRPVAVKQILARAASDKAMARFTREAELMARLKHPGIVGVHQLGKTSDGPYLVMELVEGTPLDKLLKKGPLEPQEAARLVRDMARAVAVVHAAGVLHRDLKPQNAIIRPDGAPVLLDFGLARDVDAERMTRTGEVLGTILYMPPEQANGQTDLDGRVDVYALGAILYELLAGQPPWTGDGIQLLAKILSKEEAPAPSTLREGAPPGLEAIARQAVSKDREKRYRTAQALAADLDRFLAGEPPLALGTVAKRDAGKRNTMIIAGVAGLLVVGAGVGAAVAARSGAGVSPETSNAPTSTEGKPRDAAPARAPTLWRVEPGHDLTYLLAFKEVVSDQQIELTCTLELRVTDPHAEDPPGSVRFDSKVSAMTCKLGPPNQPGGLTYDSKVPDPKHPLYFMQPAVGMGFSCVLVRETGQLVGRGVQGFDRIRKSLGSTEALRALQQVPPEMAARFLDTIFSDAFIGASMEALTYVRDPPGAPLKVGDPSRRKVRWNIARGETKDDHQAFRVEKSQEPERQALASIARTLRADDKFVFLGRSSYEGGRLVSAEAEQERITDAPEERTTMTWSMRLP